jgi:signal transduction histidine kinase/CheY-like chemotaxis protein
LYNLALFFSVRDRLYLYYVAYAVSLTLVLLSHSGLGQQYLWPDMPIVQTLMPHLAVCSAIVFGLMFADAFLHLRRALPRCRQLFQIFIAVALANGLLGTLFYAQVFSQTSSILVILGTILAFVVAPVRLIQGYRPALIYLIATGALLLGAALFAALQLNWIEYSLLARFGIQLGSAIELVLLAVALSNRVGVEREKRARIQQRTMELAREVRTLKTSTQIAEEHRSLQRSLQQAQKLRTIGEMTGGFAHDFNNILASILGFAELSRDRAAKLGDLKLAEYVGEIEHAGTRGSELVKQLLIYSRAGPTAPHNFDLLATIDATVAFLRSTLPATVRISTELPRDDVQIFADPAHIQQLLVNVALNAADAMNERGELSVSLRRDTVAEHACASCAARFRGEYLVLTVADRGRGITGNVQDLFTPFYTSKPVGGGSGLGLSVVHGIAHEYGGHIHIEPRVNGGTNVAIYLPPGDERALPATSTGNRILLIDDDRAIARYLETLLTSRGYVVTTAFSSTEALERVMVNPDAFDLVITDQLMPHITGLELARDIFDVRADLPVVLCSGDPDQVERSALAHTSIRAVFGKPIESELLLAKVAGLLAQPSAG